MMTEFLWPELGLLRDGVIELIYPSPEAAQSLVDNSRDPLVQELLPDYFAMTEAELSAWMPKVSFGRYILPKLDCPIYWFWINRIGENGAWDIVGDLQLRIHEGPSAVLASGHVGYHVLPQFWNRGYMTQALNLSKRVFRAHGMAEIIVTCRPNNHASARVAEKAGGRLLEVRRFSKAERERYAITDFLLCRYALSTCDDHVAGV